MELAQNRLIRVLARCRSPFCSSSTSTIERSMSRPRSIDVETMVSRSEERSSSMKSWSLARDSERMAWKNGSSHGDSLLS